MVDPLFLAKMNELKFYCIPGCGVTVVILKHRIIVVP